MDRQGQQQRANAIKDAERAQQAFFVMVGAAGLLTFLLVGLAGWYATKSITVPLAELASGAQALAQGDFSHQVSVYGNDELAAVGRAFNHAARQLQELYDALRHSNRELQAISTCNQVLLRATDEQRLLEEICRIVCEEAGYRIAFVAYAEHDEAKSVRPVAWTGAEEGYLATAGLTWAEIRSQIWAGVSFLK